VEDPQLASLREYQPSPQPFIIDKEGEMPAGAPTHSSEPISRQETPTSFGSTAALSLLPPYEVPDDITRTSTPDPIKVKKKKASSKKKRTTNLTVHDSSGLY
jgi:AP-3 complex subunit delta